MKIIHFADLHLGVESYGHTNPETGLSTRLEDFLRALDELVDYALTAKVDLVLFCGDAYKSREPSQTQQREFAKRIKRLSAGGIPLFLLVGNHDLPGAIGGATTPEIFDTLAVDNVRVARKPGIHRIPTSNGTIQIVSLPWLRRTALLTREETRNLTPEELNERLQQVLTTAVSTYAAQLDPELPALLAAHVWVSGSRVGSEKAMTVGQDPVLLLSSVALPAFDYIALGHIHKNQVLHEDPPVVYAGSLERVDFGEAADEKGFYLVDIGADKAEGRRQVKYEFHPVGGRRFLNIEVAIEAEDADPTATVLQAITAEAERLPGAIARLLVTLPAEREGLLNDSRIRNAAGEAHYFTLAKDVRRETRLRLGDVAAEELTPLAALQRYLDTRKELSRTRARLLRKHGEELIRKHPS